MAKVVQDRQDFKTLLGLIELVDIALYGIDLEQINATYKLTYLPKHLIQSRENIIKMNVPTLPGFADIETFIKYIDRDLINDDDDDKAI
jgi:hypothetical protein